MGKVNRLAMAESAMRVILEFSEAFNRHDLPGMARLLSSECLLDSAVPAPGGTAYTGKEAVMQFWQGFFEQHPQARLEIEEIFGFGERGVLRWKRRQAGTAGYLRGAEIFRVKNDLICEQHSYVKGSYAQTYESGIEKYISPDRTAR